MEPHKLRMKWIRVENVCTFYRQLISFPPFFKIFFEVWISFWLSSTHRTGRMCVSEHHSNLLSVGRHLSSVVYSKKRYSGDFVKTFHKFTLFFDYNEFISFKCPYNSPELKSTVFCGCTGAGCPSLPSWVVGKSPIKPVRPQSDIHFLILFTGVLSSIILQKIH